MKIIAIAIVALFWSVSAQAEISVGMRYVPIDVVTVNNITGGESLTLVGNPNGAELYSEYVTKKFPWLGIELGVAFGSSLPDEVSKKGDFITPFKLNASSSVIPHLTAKSHLRIGRTDSYLGVGVQYAQVDGFTQQNFAGTVETGSFDPGCGCFVFSTQTLNMRTRYPVAGTGISPVIQLGTDVKIWRDFSLGIDIKVTPWDIITADLSKMEQSTDGGEWVKYYNSTTEKGTITRLLRGGVTLSYLF
jgi:hypothetical protein